MFCDSKSISFFVFFKPVYWYLSENSKFQHKPFPRDIALYFFLSLWNSPSLVNQWLFISGMFYVLKQCLLITFQQCMDNINITSNNVKLMIQNGIHRSLKTYLQLLEEFKNFSQCTMTKNFFLLIVVHTIVLEITQNLCILRNWDVWNLPK